MTRILNSMTLLYAIMLYPAWPIAYGFVDEGAYYPQLMFDSGLWGIYFLVITIAVTPTLLIINRIGYGASIGRWLLKRRRHFGLATGIYAGLHMMHYLLEADGIETILDETLELKFATAWIAMIIMILLSVTSNNASIRKMGRKWKRLHNWVYPAAAFTFLHWYLFDWNTARVMFWLGIFCAIKLGHSLIKLIPRRGQSPARKPAS